MKYSKLFLLFFSLLISCGPGHNKFGYPRFKKEKFNLSQNFNTKAEQLVQLKSLYVLDKNGLKDVVVNGDNNFNSGMVFYKGGLVAIFKGDSLRTKTYFDPREADMGYYNYSSNSLYIESKIPVPGIFGTKYLSSLEKLISNKSNLDTLILESRESAINSKENYRYIRIANDIKRVFPTPDY